MIKNDRPIEYQMTKKMFNTLLEKRNAVDMKENPYAYVTRVVNEQFGLRGTVARVLVYDN